MSKKTTLLIPFDMIIDTDYGIIQVVKEKYKDNKYMNKNILTAMDEENILFSMLVGRLDSNIMRLLLKPEYKNSAENLYKQIKDADYLDIINKSCITNIAMLVEEYMKTNLFEITLWCRNAIEKKFMQKELPKLNIIVANNLSMIDLLPYDAIFLKDIKDAKNLNTTGRTIYMGNYRFNYEEPPEEQNVHKVGPLMGYVPANTEVKAVDVYNIAHKDQIK